MKFSPLFKKYSNLGSVVLVLLVISSICLFLLLFNRPSSKSSILGDTKNLDSLYVKGIDLLESGKPDSALMVMTTVAQYAGERATTADSILAARAYNVAGVINFYNKNYTGAYSFYRKAIKAGGDKNTYWATNNIGIILGLFHDYRNAERFIAKSYRMARDANDWRHLNDAYYNLLNLGFIYNQLDSLDDIMKDYQTLPIPSDTTSAFINEVSNAMRLYRDRNYTDAIGRLFIADSLSSKSRMAGRAKIESNMFLSKAFLENSQPDSALSYLNKAVNLAESQELGDYVVEIYEKIIDCYQYMNRLSDANEYRSKYYTMRDSLSSINDMTATLNLEKNYEIEKYEEKVALVVSEKKEFSKWLIFTCLFLVITIVFLIITFLQKRKLQTSNIELFNKNIALLKAFEEEKNKYLSAKDFYLKSQSELPTVSTPTNPVEADHEANPKQPTQKEEIDVMDQKDLTNVNIPLDEQNRIKNAIKNFFYCSTEYLSTDFSQRRLCEIVGSNRLYVSYVINKVMGTTFHALLNEYRINEVKIRLLDNENYGNMTVEAIAESVGYKSRSNFTLNFKKYTGLTTSEFLAIAKTTSPKNKKPD